VGRARDRGLLLEFEDHRQVDLEREASTERPVAD
jgi:hypothetical protein